MITMGPKSIYDHRPYFKLGYMPQSVHRTMNGVQVNRFLVHLMPPPPPSLSLPPPPCLSNGDLPVTPLPRLSNGYLPVTPIHLPFLASP